MQVIALDADVHPSSIFRLIHTAGSAVTLPKLIPAFECGTVSSFQKAAIQISHACGHESGRFWRLSFTHESRLLRLLLVVCGQKTTSPRA